MVWKSINLTFYLLKIWLRSLSECTNISDGINKFIAERIVVSDQHETFRFM